jgi:coenzyme PQQ synthesis protein D (PqqD)
VTARFRLGAAAVFWDEVDGEVVALETESSKHIAVNRAGTVLWRLLADGAERDELVRSLAGAYAIDRAQAEHDVDAFVAMLERRGLLEE